jgi:Zn-finger nucleic acid-binding protein
MEELFELRRYLEQQRYTEALALLGEMEEMSRDDKINKIYSHAVILLLHLIKQAAEQRTTRSWNFSIWEATREIIRTNKCRKAGGYYLKEQELNDTLQEAYPTALKRAAMEAFEGRYSDEELDQQVNAESIQTQAMNLLKQEMAVE